jgi:deoxyadenosine/deoxycytidine kinase
LTLDDDEFRLYQKIYDELQLKAPVPDLVIYLQAKPAVLLERVHGRGIGYEQSISADYLQRLGDSYARFFYSYDAAPLFTVNCEHLDFVHRDADFKLLVQQIDAMRGSREFFNRAG